MNRSIGLVVPTLNAGTAWSQWLEGYRSQTLQATRSLVIDSSSSDATQKLAAERGLEVKVINRADFNHGATRQMGVSSLVDAEIVVFMTQDALLEDKSAIEKLVAAFDDPTVGAAYGRQLPHKNASPIAAHARLFNYPDCSYLRTKADIPKFGIKSAFFSNSFSAYRLSALEAVGGFPSHLIMNEDTYVAARMLQSDWKIAYVAEAVVHHSHEYSISQDFRRYFDIGAFHAREKWIREQLGNAEKTGMQFLKSETQYLLKNRFVLLPSSLMRTVVKYIGYRLGLKEKSIPLGLKKKMSMHSQFWISGSRTPSENLKTHA
jgi:rhamnosyltransferase